MPLSYHGFGPAAILVMIASVIIGEIYKSYKHKRIKGESKARIS